MVSLGDVAKEVFLRIDQGAPGTPALTKSGVFELTKAMFDVCSQALAAGEEVSVPKFGKFAVQVREARKGRNPHTGDTIDIPAKAGVKFKPSSVLRAAVGEIDVKKIKAAEKKAPKKKPAAKKKAKGKKKK